MKFKDWYKFLDKINRMNSHVKVIYSAKGIRTRYGTIQAISTKWIQIDDKRISYRRIIDIVESEVSNEQT